MHKYDFGLFLFFCELIHKVKVNVNVCIYILRRGQSDTENQTNKSRSVWYVLFFLLLVSSRLVVDVEHANAQVVGDLFVGTRQESNQIKHCPNKAE